ncbi:MAG: trypsin-like peptidase domain-containing protein [Myxococcales bacterium]|nr:trypsin-like peptidase domain-containing protein [Myxococcales bacterium]
MHRAWMIAVAAVGCEAVTPPPPVAVEPEAPPIEVAVAQEKPAPQMRVRPSDTRLVGLAEVLPEVSESVVRSVVSIATMRSTQARRTPFGLVPPQEQRGVGSGVIVRSDGIVVTNNHVVEDAGELLVTLPDGVQRSASVVGTDPATDLAVLRLADPPKGLVPLTFGDSDGLRLGEVVLAVGTPFGVGQTVTMGIVSAKGRGGIGLDYEDFIQTDAAINPGNSGGALVDLEGSLVGINTAIVSGSGGSQGVGFAIPASMASHIVDELLEHGRVERGWLGVQLMELDPDTRSTLGVVGGALVVDVVPGTPAAAAGLKGGDVFVEFQGEPVPDMARLRNRVAAAGANADFAAKVLRDGESVRLEGTLGRLPPSRFRRR